MDDDDDDHVVLGNDVVPLIVLIHNQRLLTVGPEEQITLGKDGDEVEA